MAGIQGRINGPEAMGDILSYVVITFMLAFFCYIFGGMDAVIDQRYRGRGHSRVKSKKRRKNKKTKKRRKSKKTKIKRKSKNTNK
jgi:hypothetical protein